MPLNAGTPRGTKHAEGQDPQSTAGPAGAIAEEPPATAAPNLTGEAAGISPWQKDAPEPSSSKYALMGDRHVASPPLVSAEGERHVVGEAPSGEQIADAPIPEMAAAGRARGTSRQSLPLGLPCCFIMAGPSNAVGCPAAVVVSARLEV
jgi:hypothetical protein